MAKGLVEKNNNEDREVKLFIKNRTIFLRWEISSVSGHSVKSNYQISTSASEGKTWEDDFYIYLQVIPKASKKKEKKLRFPRRQWVCESVEKYRMCLSKGHSNFKNFETHQGKLISVYRRHGTYIQDQKAVCQILCHFDPNRILLLLKKEKKYANRFHFPNSVTVKGYLILSKKVVFTLCFSEF